MFMKFEMADQGIDANGDLIPLPEGQPKEKICINIKNITSVRQFVTWVRETFEVPPDAFDDMIARPRPTRPRNAGRRDRDVMRIIPDRFIIQMDNGNNWTVFGNFDELTDMLSHFSTQKESV